MSRRRDRVRTARIGFAVAPPVVAAGLGGLASRNAPQVYGELDKPSWAPPARAFGPVWSVLYVALGVVGWRVFRLPRTVRALHVAQLALNTAWPATFFALRRKPVSLGTIVALDALVAAEIAQVARHDRVAAALLAPYAAWLGYATALNAAVTEPAR